MARGPFSVLGPMRRVMIVASPGPVDGGPVQLRTLPESLRLIWATRHKAYARIVRLVDGTAVGCRLVHRRSERDVARVLSEAEAGSRPA